MLLKILVPTDGSKTSQKAGAYAVGLAKQLHASIIIMSVIDKGGPYYYGFPWTKRFSSCDPWECYLWCDTQRYDNPNSGGKEEMMCVQC